MTDERVKAEKEHMVGSVASNEETSASTATPGIAPVEISEADLAAVAEQLGRPTRGMRAVAFRCADGHPAVVETLPRLPDGTPFPTLYYLTCPRLVAAVSRLEAEGAMREMAARLSAEPELADTYARAHEGYLARRYELGDVPEIHGISAGGMPTRVKCLHVLVGHALAAGPGVNPFGDEALTLMASWLPPGHGRSAESDGDTAKTTEPTS